MPFFLYPVKVTKVLLGLSYFVEKHVASSAMARYWVRTSGLGTGLSGLLGSSRRIAPCLSGVPNIEC